MFALTIYACGATAAPIGCHPTYASWESRVFTGNLGHPRAPNTEKPWEKYRKIGISWDLYGSFMIAKLVHIHLVNWEVYGGYNVTTNSYSWAESKPTNITMGAPHCMLSKISTMKIGIGEFSIHPVHPAHLRTSRGEVGSSKEVSMVKVPSGKLTIRPWKLPIYSGN
jgi:hypothetical protein